MIRAFFDLSLRFKIPIWGSALILAAAATVAAALMLRTYDRQREDLYLGAEALAHYLASALSEPLVNDDPWHAYEIVRTAVPDATVARPGLPELILVLDAGQSIFASTRPREFRMLASARYASAPIGAVAARLSGRAPQDRSGIRHEGEDRFYVATDIVVGDAMLGHVVLAYPRDRLEGAFTSFARDAAATTAIMLILLLPAHWYWARRTVQPVLTLADRMAGIGRGTPRSLDRSIYPYRDEIGQLFDAYARMLEQLQQKLALESEIVKTERLTSLGRLSAGIAHEINNPLAGLLTAISTLRIRADADARTLRTVDLIERGLLQIRDTVAALLVEAKAKTRDLSPQDVDDVRTLLEPLARKKGVRLAWRNTLERALPLPANMVRQALMNLLLNAIQAAGGQVDAAIELATDDGQLRLTVVDDGSGLSTEIREHLFEPFASTGGAGLGLWVTYQIVQQMHGRIDVRSGAGETRFEVMLPVVKEAA